MEPILARPKYFAIKPILFWLVSVLFVAALILWQNKYILCPNIKCILQADDALSVKFSPNIPIFLDWPHSTNLLTAIPEFKEVSKIHHMLDVLTANTQYMQQLAPVHPTCAVVGNSQNLINSHYGPKIDAHDYIFRMNSAPIVSYEKDVGRRTTHHIFSHFFGHYFADGKLGVRVYDPSTLNILLPAPDDIQVNSGPIYQKTDYHDYQGFLANLADALSKQGASIEPLSRTNLTELHNIPKLLVLSPEFMWYVNLIWFKPDQKEKADRASTGFDTIILALQLCDRVDVFGFGADKSGNWGHYFKETKNNKPAIHRVTYQYLFIKGLQEKHIITVYSGM